MTPSRAAACLLLLGLAGCKSKESAPAALASTSASAVAAATSASAPPPTRASTLSPAPSASAAVEACDPARDPARVLELSAQADRALAKKAWPEAIAAYGEALTRIDRCHERAELAGLGAHAGRLLQYRAFAHVQRSEADAAQRDLDAAAPLCTDPPLRARLEYYRGLIAELRKAPIEAVEHFALSQTIAPNPLAQGALDARATEWALVDAEGTRAGVGADTGTPCKEALCAAEQGYVASDEGATWEYRHKLPHWEGDDAAGDVFGCGSYASDLQRREVSVDPGWLVLREDAAVLKMTVGSTYNGEHAAHRFTAGKCVVDHGSYRLAIVDRARHRLGVVALFTLSADGGTLTK